MLIEVHIIQNHAPCNLNRDDSGSPKTAMFGGYRRARISSQCLKRCYRTSKTFRKEVDGFGMNSCAMPDEIIRRVLGRGAILTPEEQIRLKTALANVIKKEDSAQGDKLKTSQSVFWRETELEALAGGLQLWVQNGKSGDFDAKSVLREAGLSWAGIPVDMALFGRMVTTDLMLNVEASSQFAHAISTHEFVREFDLWTRVDDRRDKRLDFYDAFGTGEKLESGTDGMGEAEFTSACFYSYFNVDFCGLIDNLTGKALNRKLEVLAEDTQRAHDRAGKAVIGLVKAAICERPTGKFNSMATPSLPTLVLVEIRDNHVPVSYADAFAKPVDPKNEEKQTDTGQVQRVDLPEESARRLIKEANRITTAFCREATHRLLFTGGRELGVALDGTVVDGHAGPVRPVDNINELVEQLRTTLGGLPESKHA